MAGFSKRKGCAKNRGKAVLRAPPDIYFGLDHFPNISHLGEVYSHSQSKSTCCLFGVGEYILNRYREMRSSQREPSNAVDLDNSTSHPTGTSRT